jgi:probable HAF family extracellular repeat protein
MRRLQDVLATDYGLADQLNGWNLWQAWAISDDGMTIVGAGTNPAGQGEVWVATISAPSVTLIGDANGDGVVDNADFAVVVANYGMTSGATVAQGDFDGNARVNLRDVLLVKTHFGERLSAASRAPLAAAIPEPASWLVALLAAIVIVAFRIAAWLRLRATVTLAVALITFFAAGSARANGYSFTPLGFLPAADFSIARGISADGSVIVGWSSSASGTEEAFRWTNAGGMVGLGNLPGGTFGSFASGVSTNGSVIVGSSPSSGTPREAFRWTSGGGMVGLGDLPGGDFYSGAIGVSSDGSVIVGLSESASSASGFEAFRWTNAGGMVGLGDLPGGVFFSVANAVSADGSVIVGNSFSTLENEAFRWTIAGGMVGLGDLPGGIFRSVANDVSADGSVVVGWSSSASGTEAFRWTSGSGMVGLGRLPGSTTSFAYGISADGSVVVGQSNSAAGSEALYWTATDGMVSLRSLLAAGGVSGLTEWSGLFGARDVSADGRTIVGIGTNPAGQNEAWVATIGDSPVLIGDANGDGVVDAADLAIVVANYGTTTGALVAQGDFDGNARVNLRDVLLVKTHFGETLSAASRAPFAAAIPEPPSWLVALLAAIVIVAFRIAAWLRLRAVVPLAVALISFYAAGSARANGYSFTPLGDLPGGSTSSRANGISADGSVIVGSSSSASGNEEAFRWTNAGGMVGLGDLPGGTFVSFANDVSTNGSVVVGSSSSAAGSEGFRWTSGGGMVGLGDLPGGDFYSGVTGVSSDGSVIVGVSESASGREAFRWTSTAGMVGLGELPGGNFFSAATGVSSDGSLIVGNTSSASGTEAFRWTNAGGMVGLGDLPGGNFRSLATDVSADGSVIIGESSSASGTEAFRWTSGSGMVGLGRLPGSTSTIANGISADGSVIVGFSGPDGFRWTATDGMVSLRSLLGAAGVFPGVTGWVGLSPIDVSADGRTIVGFGGNQAGQVEAFVATIGDSPVLIGDANGDGIVDNADLATIVSNFGTTSGATVTQGDLDGNGREPARRPGSQVSFRRDPIGRPARRGDSRTGELVTGAFGGNHDRCASNCDVAEVARYRKAGRRANLFFPNHHRFGQRLFLHAAGRSARRARSPVEPPADDSRTVAERPRTAAKAPPPAAKAARMAARGPRTAARASEMAAEVSLPAAKAPRMAAHAPGTAAKLPPGRPKLCRHDPGAAGRWDLAAKSLFVVRQDNIANMPRTAVPEPTTLMFALAGLGVLTRLRTNHLPKT